MKNNKIIMSALTLTLSAVLASCSTETGSGIPNSASSNNVDITTEANDSSDTETTEANDSSEDENSEADTNDVVARANGKGIIIEDNVVKVNNGDDI